jgi:TRAP transporter TAXI family solute receptor
MTTQRMILCCVLLTCMLLSFQIHVMANDYSITFYTGAVGGLYMAPAVVWVEQWHEVLPNVDISVVLGGSVTNPLELARSNPNEAIGFTTLPLASDVQRGAGDYETRFPGGYHDFRALWRANVPTWGAMIARPEVVPTGVTTIGEFLATKPAVHWVFKIRGSGAETKTRLLLEEYGLTYQDLQSWGGRVSFNNPTDSADMMINGQAHVYMDSNSVPTAHVLDMDASIKNLVWLGVEPEVAKRMEEKYGYIADIHPMGHYSTLTEEVLALNYDHVVFVHKDMDEELVYQLVKTILENPEPVRGVPSWENFDPEVIGKQTVFPLHEGAARAYRELGYIE